MFRSLLLLNTLEVEDGGKEGENILKGLLNLLRKDSEAVFSQGRL
jgi:hypothetical protein